MAVKKKKKVFVSANSFKQLLFSLYCHILVDMRANFWKAFNISLNMKNKIVDTNKLLLFISAVNFSVSPGD